MPSYLTKIFDMIANNLIIDSLSMSYSLLTLLVLFHNLRLIYYKKPIRLFHCTSSLDAKTIIGKRVFETRTEGLMFCSLKKNNSIGSQSAAKADFTFIITGKAINSYRPIALGFIRFLMPWALWKSFRGEWVTKKKGDVKIKLMFPLCHQKLSYIFKIKTIEHKGLLRTYSLVRSIGVLFLNFLILGWIYFRWQLIYLAIEYKYTSLIMTAIITVIIITFYCKQKYFNNKVRGR
ncbi:hypothetical protein ABEG45_14720 [Pantoea agglomerans]|uniref:hypothetical protein n=1 Tax=Enterobacter agglomerans TaxID=549 RepID=UPI00320AEC81